ncbi:MAG: tetraacyldisaccharide 4'-kinase, partial [Phycisphaerae bacterium]
HAEHRVAGFTDLKGRKVAVAEPEAMRAVIFAGIAHFEGFRHSVLSQGIEVLAAYEYPDHHDYTAEELSGLRDVAECLEANAILTTEKDAVKLIGRWEDEGCRLFVLQLRIVFDEAGDTIVTEALEDLLRRSARSDPY